MIVVFSRNLNTFDFSYFLLGVCANSSQVSKQFTCLLTIFGETLRIFWHFFLYYFSGSESPRPGSRASFREKDILWERRNVSKNFPIIYFINSFRGRIAQSVERSPCNIRKFTGSISWSSPTQCMSRIDWVNLDMR